MGHLEIYYKYIIIFRELGEEKYLEVSALEHEEDPVQTASICASLQVATTLIIFVFWSSPVWSGVCELRKQNHLRPLF